MADTAALVADTVAVSALEGCPDSVRYATRLRASSTC